MRWILDRIWMLFAHPALTWSAAGSALRVPPGRRSHRAPAVQVAAQRNILRHPALRAVLRAAVLRWAWSRTRTRRWRCSRVGADSADPGLRHRALPADGRGHHLPPRLCLHAGDDLRAGGVLRHWSFRSAGWCRRTSRSGQYRRDDRHADRRLPLPAHPQLDPGVARPALLPRPLRLPPHAGGVRPRTELRDRPGRHAVARWPSACCETLSIRHLAFFLADERRPESPQLPPEEGDGPQSRLAHVSYDDLDLELPELEAAAEPYLFFERTRHQLDAVSRRWPASVRRTIARSGPHLLPALHGPRPNHRLPRREPHRPTAIISPAWTWNCWSRSPATSGSRSRTRRSTARCSARWKSTSA